MELFLIVALLASNVWLIRKVLTKPDNPAPVKTTEEKTDYEKAEKAADEQQEVSAPAEEESIAGKSTFDINEFKEVFRETVREVAKETVKEIVPLIVQEAGTPADALPPDATEEKSPARIPDDRLDEVFNNVSLSELTGEAPPAEAPRTGGNDFNDLNTTIKVLKGESDNPADEQTARRVLPDLQGTAIMEKIQLDPVVRKRILLIECQVPDIPQEDGNADNPGASDTSDEPVKRRKIVFQTHIDTTDIDAVDFNMYH